MGGRGLIQVNRDAQLVGDAPPEPARELNALGQGDALQRDERNHIHGADARVGSAVMSHVDQLGGALRAGQRRLQRRLGRRDKGEHRAVVIGIAVRIEYDHSGNGADGLADGVDDLRPPAVGEIGDALDQGLGHFVLSPRGNRGMVARLYRSHRGRRPTRRSSN